MQTFFSNRTQRVQVDTVFSDLANIIFSGLYVRIFNILF